jgi:lipoprotein-anchoring transpeptidase ErfK/SrfK
MLLFSFFSYAQTIEISGSPFATEGAPLPDRMDGYAEKIIFVDPGEHVFGAYAANGKLIRWGIATSGAEQCPDTNASCRTKTGQFRIYSLGDGSCISNKYYGAPMPYCMFFNGGQALHGSSDIQFDNVSHGCIRLHVDDAKWLRYHFVEGPNLANQYRGTKVVIKSY